MLKQGLKSLYKAIPFKKQAFSCLKQVWTPTASIYRHLHFKSVFRVDHKDCRFLIRHYGYQLGNEIFFSGLTGGWEKVSMALWIDLCRQSNFILNIGANIRIVEPVNLYECALGDDCFVGPFVEIQKGVVIGARTKIQPQTFICELVTIGNDCFIAHGVMFINGAFYDSGAARGRRDLWRPTRIGDHVSIGSNATILPVSICDRAVIGAGSVVTKDLIAPGVYAGNPARKIRDLHI